MKNIYRFTACALALTAALSCSKLNETPVFEDGKSFVGFAQTTYTVNEDADSLVIPVTVASPDPVKVTVAYSVADSTAKKGTNYTLADEAAVLVYDGETRTQNIVLNVVNIATTAEKSGYTGDLVFTVTLESAGELEIGYNKTCVVKIVDLDHPLADILGTYSCTGIEYWDGEVSWTANIMKDESDVSVVWIDAFLPMFSGSYPSADFRVYGNVSDDHKTITIPAGQVAASKYGSYDLKFLSFDGQYVNDEGNITLEMNDKGVFVSSIGFTASAFLNNEYKGDFSAMLTASFDKQ